MTKRQFKTKVRSMYQNARDQQLDKVIDKAIRSGAIDLNDYENNFILPRIFITAFFEEMAFQYKPLSDDHIKTVKNLKLYL